MSGFSSLLNQFKQTTQQATSLSTSGRQSASASTNTTTSSGNKKRTRSIFETATNNQGTKKTNNTTSSSQQQNKQYKYPTKPIKTIYIACPAYTETGGPEALHQLCHMINVGGYTYEVDDDEIKEEKLTKCDEFGRALFTDSKKPSSTTTSTTTSTATSNTNNNTKEQPKKKVIKAYMLYLRERNNNTVEHVTSSNAKSIKYNKYNAPPISSSSVTGVLPSFLQQREREVDVSYTIDGVHGKKEKAEKKQEEKEGESEEYTSELIIWPECWTHLIDSLQPPSLATTSTNSSLQQQQQKQEKKKYQIAIWWLSVNNNNGRFLPNQFQLRKDVLHLVQSMYAKNYVEGMLKSNKKDVDDDSTLNVMNMSEFISYASPSFAPKIDNSKDEKEVVVRDVDVVYNTAKGQHYTDEIIKRAVGKAKPNALDGSVVGGGLKFAPIGKGHGGRERMTEKEVVDLLKRSKVYIDFGPHPGMDRLPREAVLAGCVVLTNREGAANFNEDVPLPSEFKFKNFDVEKIYTKLKECCNNHEEQVEKMNSYKQWILGQEKQMKECVDKLINHVNARRILVHKIERYTKQSSSTKGINK